MRFLTHIPAACVVALLSLATPASAEETPATTTPAQPAATDPAQQPAPPAEDPNEVICKKLPPETGTRLARTKKECHTRREWAEMAEEAKQSTEKAQNPG